MRIMRAVQLKGAIAINVQSRLVPLTHEERRRLIDVPLPTVHVYSGARWKGASAIKHWYSPGAYYGLMLNRIVDTSDDDLDDPDL